MKHVAARLGDGSGRGRFTRQRQRARKGIATTESPLSSTGRNANRRPACGRDPDQACGQLGQFGYCLTVKCYTTFAVAIIGGFITLLVASRRPDKNGSD